MNLLRAVNEILPKLGERPVTSLEAKSPTLAVILPQIECEVELCTATGWWFNTFYGVEIFPDSEGNLMVPEDTISFVTDKGQPSIVARGEQFFDSATRSYTFTEKVRGTLRQRVPFEELPENAARYVLYSSLVTIYATDIGLEQVVQLWTKYAAAALTLMEQEHLRHRKYSVKQSPQYRRRRAGMRG